MERMLLPPTGIRCAFVPMAPPSSLRGCMLLLLATIRSCILVLHFRPGVTAATGGYASVPGTVASWLFRVPVVLFLPDIVPGKAVAWLAPLSRRIAVTTEGSLRYFPAGKAVVTGYPLRAAFREASRAAGRRHLRIPDDATVLCVFGGSQGARHINEALGRNLAHLARRCHIVHVCGEQRLAEAQAYADALPRPLRDRYVLRPYLQEEEMAGALAAADLAVCRAGASVLGELPATATPAILVPLPQRTVNQRDNAEYLASRGAAVVLADERIDSDLIPAIDRLLDDPETLAEMTRACAALARPDAAEAIVGLMEMVAR